MFYIGMTFEEAKVGKEYKTDSGAKAAAEKKQVRVFDADGQVVADYAPVEPQDGPQDAPDAVGGQESTPAPDGADAAHDGPQDAPEDVTMTDDVPDGALGTDDDGDVKVYNGNGQQVGKMSAADVNKLMEQITDGGMVNIAGKIRRVFPGLLRVRNRPSWEPSAVAGVTNFEEKKVVGLLSVNGKPMYKTHDGYFITGDPAIVEYAAE